MQAKVEKNKQIRSERVLQSVLRGFQALEIVAAAHEGAALKDIAGQMGLKPPTAHILLNTLLAGGYLARRPGDLRYHLGDAAFRLTDRYLENILRQGAEQAVRSIADQLPKATVVFVEPRDYDFYTLFRISPDFPRLIQKPRERRMMPYQSATALLCQVFFTPEERLAFRQRHGFFEEGKATWGAENKLEAFLNQARQKGYVLLKFHHSGVCAMAAPVFNRRGQLAAALGVSMARADFHAVETKTIEIVMDAAGNLSAQGRTSAEKHESGENECATKKMRKREK
jgi:IclR family acetate operon transcriptional repressor